MAHDLVTIDFHGTPLLARRGPSPTETLVAMKPIVEGMGLQWEEQRLRLHRHPLLKSALTFSMVQMPGDDQRREWTFLSLTRLNFWLATIQPNKVPDPETRDRIIRYQIECADALFAHFFAKAAAKRNKAIPTKDRGSLSRQLRKLKREYSQIKGISVNAVSRWLRQRYEGRGIPRLDRDRVPGRGVRAGDRLGHRRRWLPGFTQRRWPTARQDYRSTA